MTYVDGFILPLPNGREQEYRKQAELFARKAGEQGAIGTIEALSCRRELRRPATGAVRLSGSGAPFCRRAGQARASPTWSAIDAPRSPRGLSGPTVVSWAVWCSSSAFSSAPMSTTHMER